MNVTSSLLLHPAEYLEQVKRQIEDLEDKEDEDYLDKEDNIEQEDDDNTYCNKEEQPTA